MKSFVFNYDLTLHMNPSVGTLTFFEDGRIESINDGETLFEGLAQKPIKEAVVKAGVGCGLIFLKYEDESAADTILCRFTMSGLRNAGEICKIINYYLQSGIALIPDALEKQVCEKCGRALIEGMNVCIFCYDKLSVLMRAMSYLKPYAKPITAAQALTLFSTIVWMLSPIFTRILIDRYLEPQLGTWQEISILAGALLLSRIIGEITFIIGSRIFNRASISYCNDLRVTTYEKLQKHSMTVFAKRTPGDLIRRVMEDTGTITEFMTDIGRWAIEQTIVFAVVCIILLATNWQLTILVFIPIPIVAFSLTRFWRIIRNRYERQWRKSSRVNSILHDIIKGIRTVKSFGNEEAEIKKFAGVNYELAKISSDNEALWARLFPLLMFFTGIGEFLILYFGGRMVMGGTLTLGVLVQFTMYIAHVYGPLRWVVNLPRWIANATTSMVKVFEILDEESEIGEQESPNNVPIAGGVMLKNVSFGYKSYEPVLKGIDLEIKPGEMIGLVGKSGVGKSTLINLVMRLYDPNIGSISINDTDIRSISPQHLHENIGVVFQDSFLFAGSYYENIVYAKPDATYEEVIAAAKAANAHDFIVQSADGYNTLIGEGGLSISGGERQRLSIARAIIKNPDILILDEATSSLDVETEAAIQESLKRLTKGRTTIAIAHRLSTLRNADRLVVLSEGQVAELGTHKELLRKKGIYYNLVMAQRQNSKLAEGNGSNQSLI
jgi:ATP-binding cassette subfamily B protein